MEWIMTFGIVFFILFQWIWSHCDSYQRIIHSRYKVGKAQYGFHKKYRLLGFYILNIICIILMLTFLIIRV